MSSFKSHPVFFGSLLACGVISAAMVGLIFYQRSAAAKTEAEIQRKRVILENFSYQNPFPSRANLQAVSAHLAQVEKTRAEIRNLLQAKSEVSERIAAARIPANSTEAYFDIASFVENVRASLRARGIATAADNRFGFSLYANVGPERDLIPLVFRQRQHLEYLITTLIASGPTQIGEIRRERPLTPAQRQQIEEALASGQTPPTFGGGPDVKDYFVIDPLVTAKVPGFVSTEAYRLEFKGNTLALRAFLNELAQFKLPVVVRSVEVSAPSRTANRPASTPATRPTGNLLDLFSGATGDETNAARQVEKPIVDQEDSSFVVTVEIVSLVEKNIDGAESATEPL